jgi:hypothetical protein
MLARVMNRLKTGPGYAELLRVWLDAIEQDYATWTGDSAQSNQD